jgi:hypothetical protein
MMYSEKTSHVGMDAESRIFIGEGCSNITFPWRVHRLQVQIGSNNIHCDTLKF